MLKVHTSSALNVNSTDVISMTKTHEGTNAAYRCKMPCLCRNSSAKVISAAQNHALSSMNTRTCCSCSTRLLPLAYSMTKNRCFCKQVPVSTPHTVPNNFTSALISNGSQGLHLTAVEEMTKKINKYFFLETVSFDPQFV